MSELDQLRAELEARPVSFIDEAANVTPDQVESLKTNSPKTVVISRISAITEAIRDGDRERVETLLIDEYGRLLDKKRLVADEHRRIEKMLDSINDFEIEISASVEKWNQARRECGWEGKDNDQT